jgi:hypothetical protein
MADALMIATMVAFVLVCVGYVAWCERIVTADDVDDLESAASEPAPVTGTPR